MTLTSLHSQGVDDPDYLPVHTYVLNPKVLKTEIARFTDNIMPKNDL